jgi:hypothetical protein
LLWGIAIALVGGTSACDSSAVDEGGGSGGTAGGSSGSGGTGATGGTSSQGLGGTGGTGGSVPNPPAAAGLTITVTQPSETEVPGLGTRSCIVASTGYIMYAIGVPAPGGTVPDGTGDVQVSCTVGLNSDGATMSVYANVSGSDANYMEPISLEVTSPTIHSRDPAPAVISFGSSDNGQLVPLDGLPGCTLGPFGTLKNGAMLADFTCPLLGSPDDASVGCRVNGTLGVEYCQTSD